MADQWHYWRQTLAGEMLPIHADQPQSGFYRMRARKDGPWLPVAIWINGEGDMICKTPSGAVDPVSIWTRVADKPVTREDAKMAFDTGAWPGDVEAPAAIGDNSGDVSILEELADYQSQALAWLGSVGEVGDKVTSDKAANYAVHLGQLKSKADKERKDLVQPHLDAQRDINGQYNPPIKAAEQAVTKLKRAQDAYLIAEKRRLEAEAKRKYQEELARAEAERKRIEDERAKQMESDPIAATTEPAPEVAPPPPPPEPVKVSAGGQAGRKVALKKFVVYEIGNWNDVWAWARDDGEAAELIEKLAIKRARAGEDVPGIIKTIEERAA